MKNNKMLLNEIKMEQVLPRFESKPFRKAIVRIFFNGAEQTEDLYLYYKEFIIELLKDFVPENLNNKNKAECLNWLISIFITHKINRNFAYRYGENFFLIDMKPYLQRFYEIKEKYKNILRIKDINLINSPEELSKVIYDANPKYEQILLQGYNFDKVYEDEEWKVFFPLNNGAACELGKGTSWCTSRSHTFDYEKYAKQGQLIVFISKFNEKEKFQLFYGKEKPEFKDRNDHEVLDDLLFYKLNEIVKIFQDKLSERERDLVNMYDYKKFDDGSYLKKNRDTIYYFDEKNNHIKTEYIKQLSESRKRVKPLKITLIEIKRK